MVRAPALSRRARRLSVRHFALLAKFAQLFDRLLIVFVCFFLFLFCIYFCRRVSVSFVILFFACFACFCLVSADLCRVVFESKRSMFNCINRYIYIFLGICQNLLSSCSFANNRMLRIYIRDVHTKRYLNIFIYNNYLGD